LLPLRCQQEKQRFLVIKGRSDLQDLCSFPLQRLDLGQASRFCGFRL